MPRFKLDPNKTAMENVFACASMATTVIMRSHAWYHLYGELRGELFDEVRDATVAHFITYKVMKHGYRRFAKDGTPLNFASNMISSCYAVCGHIADRFLKRLTRITKTEDIEPFAYGLGPGDGFPLYMSDDELDRRYHPRKRNRTCDRAREVREAYLEYTLEAEEMGLSNILEFGPWIARNGYSRDEGLMWALEPRPVRRSMLAERLKMKKKTELAEAEAHLDESTRKHLTNRRDYHREYARRRREKERAEVDRELREVLGAPPEGYQWFETKNGRVGQRRLKK